MSCCPPHLVPELLFEVLLRVGLLTVAAPDEDGQAGLALTDAGRARYEELRERLAGARDAPL